MMTVSDLTGGGAVHQHAPLAACNAMPHRSGLTLAELLTGTLTLIPAAIMLTAYGIDTLGFPIDPLGITILLSLEAIGFALCLRHSSWRPSVRFDHEGFVGFAVVSLGLLVYLLWLAGPSFLPLDFSADMVHHVSLGNFIYYHHSLIHDTAISKYLSESIDYTPGAHILAALVAAWSGTTPVRVMYPILALLVACKAAYVFHILLRLQHQKRPALAVAGALLLLVVPGYFLSSFTFWGFYAQVVSETFALAMLWAAVVVWRCQPTGKLMLFCTLCGCAIYLSWPVWLPVTTATLSLVLFLQPGLALRVKGQFLALMLIPITALVAIFASGRMLAASQMATLGGGVIKPAPDVYGTVFLVMLIWGIAVTAIQRRAPVVWTFTSLTLIQMAGLFVVAALAHETSFYLPFKMFHLLLYPLVLWAALALDDFWRVLEHAVRPSWRRASIVFPIMALLFAWQNGLPLQAASSITESIFQAGMWARSNLAIDCIDYAVEHRQTAYWLHVALLGNPRETLRTDAILGAPDTRFHTPAVWTNPDGLMYAVVENWRGTPEAVRARVALLYEAGNAAVVQYTDEGVCRTETLSLDRVQLAPRGWTLASWLFGGR